MIGFCFSAPAADKQPASTASPSEASSSPSEGKGEEAVPREFLRFADVPEFRGVIDDPDGYVNLRKEKRADASVITKVKAGEPFEFQKKEDDEWCSVKLKSGVSGWMHDSRIKHYFTREDLPPKGGSYMDKEAREQGVNYYEVTQAAARGDKKALKKFFTVEGDGEAGEEHEFVEVVVIHLIGDDTLAKFLSEQPRQFREGFSSSSMCKLVAWPFETIEYFGEHFPKSAELLFPDDQVIRDYTRVTKLNPKDSRAYCERGIAEYEKRNWDRAIAYLDRAIQLDPNNDRAYWKRGCVRCDKGEYDTAVENIQKAIELNGRYAGYYVDLGSCQLFNGKPREAIAASLKALELSPDDAVLIKTNLANGYLFDNQFDKAKAIYLENKDAKLRDESETFRDTVLDDFKQLEEAGATHPDMKKIKALLTSKTQDTNSTNSR